MDVLPMCSIFQELQIVHDTGYFSALPSLEEYWQQVNMSACLSRSLPLREQEGRENSRGRGRRCLVVGCFFGFCFFWHRMRSEVCGSEVDQCVSLTAGAPPTPPTHTPLQPATPAAAHARREPGPSPITGHPITGSAAAAAAGHFHASAGQMLPFSVTFFFFFFLTCVFSIAHFASPSFKRKKERKERNERNEGNESLWI